MRSEVSYACLFRDVSLSLFRQSMYLETLIKDVTLLFSPFAQHVYIYKFRNLDYRPACLSQLIEIINPIKDQSKESLKPTKQPKTSL